MEKIDAKELTKWYNELQELWWKLKHDNSAHIDGVKGYEHVNTAANCLLMQTIEELMEKIDAKIGA